MAASAWAQAAKRIDPFEPEFDKIISTSEPILELATGFGGGGNTEGPVWWKEGGYLLFSSIGDNQPHQVHAGTGHHRRQGEDQRRQRPDPRSPGPAGRLRGPDAGVTREEADGSITVIANSFQGRPLNKPNDVVVKSDGCDLFHRSLEHRAAAPAMGPRLQRRVSGVAGPRHLNLLVDTFVLPNGLAFSPDEECSTSTIPRRRQIHAFDVLPNGLLAQTERVFVELTGAEPGCPDGMKVDIAGNVYCGGPGGIYVMDPRAGSSAASSTAIRRPPTSLSVATIGRRSISPAVPRWAPSG